VQRRNANGPPKRAARHHIAATPSPPSNRGADEHRVTETTPCKWLAAAARTGDLAVELAVLTYHPAERCPARRAA